MDQDFATMQLPDAPDAVAPDGSDVRVLLRLGRGSMAHFELGAGRVSRAVAHRAVDEIWYILAGQGQMWRRQADRQETVPLRPGTCVSIPAGTHFQFRSATDGPLTAVGVTMPPWPGDDEAYEVPGGWDTTLDDRTGDRATRAVRRRIPGLPRPGGLADFYLELLGGQVLWRSADSAGIRVPGVVLAMQRVAGYRPPGPDPPWSTWI